MWGPGPVGPTYSRPAPTASLLLPRCYRLVAAPQPGPWTIGTDSTHHTQEVVNGEGSSAVQVSAPSPTGDTRYDGGPEEGTRGVVPAQQAGVRYDGGPEEGTASLIQRSAPATFEPNSIKSSPAVRYDGGPEEGSRGSGH